MTFDVPTTTIETDTATIGLESERYSVTSLEHRLRKLFATTPTGDAIEQSSDIVDDVYQADAPVKSYVTSKADQMNDEIATVLTSLFDAHEEYFDNVTSHLQERAQRATETRRYDDIKWEIRTLAPNSSTSTAAHEPDTLSAEVDAFPNLSRASRTYDFDFPLTTVCCIRDTTHRNVYPMIPADGTLLCTCGDKFNNAKSPLCYHELGALIELYESGFEYDMSHVDGYLVHPMKS